MSEKGRANLWFAGCGSGVARAGTIFQSGAVWMRHGIAAAMPYRRQSYNRVGTSSSPLRRDRRRLLPVLGVTILRCGETALWRRRRNVLRLRRFPSTPDRSVFRLRNGPRRSGACILSMTTDGRANLPVRWLRVRYCKGGGNLAIGRGLDASQHRRSDALPFPRLNQFRADKGLRSQRPAQGEGQVSIV